MIKSKPAFIIILVFCLVVIIWILFQIAMSFVFSNLNSRALFGDSFGALNTLFTGLAFAGVVISLIFQKNELELQRKELELTREEFAISEKSQQEIIDSSKTQSIIHAKTARLNALSAMLTYWNNQPQNSRFPGSIEKSIENIYDKINKVYFELEELDKKK